MKRLKVAEGRDEFWDQVEKGLVLRISADGSKVWSVRYRLPDGRRRRFKLGRYPEVSLATARSRAKAVKGDVAKDADPQAERRAKRREAAIARHRTVATLAEQFVEELRRQGGKSWREQERQLRKDVLPTLGPMPAGEVSPQEVQRVLDRILRRGRRKGLERAGGVMANRTRSVIVQLFSYALTQPDWRHLLQGNPAQAVPKPLKREPPREREFTEDELRRLWEATEAVHPVIGVAFKVRMLTGQRWAEVAGMRWDELRRERVEVGTLRGRDIHTWTLPASRTKARREHVLPLPIRPSPSSRHCAV